MKIKILRIISTTFALFSLAFIYYNSMQNGTVSSQNSGSAVQIINQFFSKILPSLKIDESTVRILGHFLEFALFGFLLTLCYKTFELNGNRFFFIPLIIGFFMPITDELLQLTSEGRAFQFSDILCDWAGEIFGLILALLILIIVYKLHNNKQQSVAEKKGQ